MDNFDKVIADKVNQNLRTDQDQAWSDFQSYKKSQSDKTKASSPFKIWIRNGLILLFVSVISASLGYQFAQSDNQSIIADKSMSHPLMSMERLHSDLAVNLALSSPKYLLKTTPIRSSINTVQPVAFVPNPSLPKMMEANNIATSKADSTLVSPVSAFDIKGTTLSVSERLPVSSNITLADSGKMPYGEVELFSNEENLSSALSKETLESKPQIEAKLPVVSSVSTSGKVKKNRKNVLKNYVSTFKHYTDVSLLSLDNSADIASIYHAQFLQNPANTGSENRYAITSGARASFYKNNNQLFNSAENEVFVANSFTLANNKIGVGIAINHATSPSANVMNLFVSSAYNLTLSKNQHLRVGIGINSSTIELPNSDMRTQDYNLIDFNFGTRYEYKTLFAQLSVNNLAPITAMSRNLYPNSIFWQFTSGGRLLLSKKRAIHPEIMVGQNDSGFELGSKIGFSYRNKWLFGLQTDDYKSIGLHAGASFGRRLTVLLKTDVFNNINSDNRISERGAVLVKFELGKFKR